MSSQSISSPSTSSPAIRASSNDLTQMPLTRLQGVGPALEKKFATLNIHFVLDLLFHLPFRYQDRTRVTPIAALQVGSDVVIEGRILGNAIVFGRRRSLLVKIQDQSGVANLRFFHFSAAQKSSLAEGKRIRCFGEVKWGRSGIELYHPEYKIIDEQDQFPNTTTLTPIYPSTDGLQQNRLRNTIEQALLLLKQHSNLIDYLPAELNQKFGISNLKDALLYIHQPPRNAQLSQLEDGMHPAQQRLAFEELLAHYLCLRRLRDNAQQEKAPSLKYEPTLISVLIKNLPFELTAAQQRVFSDVSKDLADTKPMLRLVQGDVGSGKTIIAILAALQAVGSAYQVAVMAPTEILAEQHFLNFTELLEGLGIEITFLSGKIKGKKRVEALSLISSGQANIIIGTHALFQDEVLFNRLGLMIIDEQHRFGVHQRLALREKGQAQGESPHQLIMTATPIPRTLMMSAYADLDCSIIDELPPGRSPVNTVLLTENRRPQVIERIQEACSNGRQAYWVCTLIEESELLQCQAAEVTFAHLQQQLKNLQVGLIHGRMKAKEKSEIMNQFKAQKIQLLVATTVIEVGVDVPNASLMIIENPERLGLAQLHQLRGRVGRGSEKSHCLLLYQMPLSNLSKQRLEIMRSSNDGFYIAQKDMEIRGPGEVLGTRQTGLMEHKIANLSRDSHLLESVKTWGERMRDQHPASIGPLIDRWLSVNQQYGKV
ncbi:MAG: ATP-dependent DNA helicase RecG [SAR86 cluster bacterium]|uniref:ATP-dependent DNA helicase RecG n=1 Tax=SAR86 cluster bacterium TaxID=2030880 RepID=A0A2A5CJ92_9GAMM|nr:MAG: ATP-dependent DNA helicase RecG [SAR86 cluster bacterium]